MKLLVDQLDALMEIFQRCCVGFQRAIEAVEDWQQSLQGVGERVVAILLLLLGVALAKVVELGLQARQAIQIGGTFSLSLLQVGLYFARLGSFGGNCPSRTFARVGRR